MSSNEIEDISMVKSYVDDAKATIIFAHGAGADKSSEFMVTMTDLLIQNQVNVIRFNFNYMDKRIKDGKRYPPERMPKLLSCFQSVLKDLKTSPPIFLMGKSMGGRVAATMAGNSELAIRGVICLGYPFHPQKQPEKLRLEPLQQTTKPILIVQGTRDALGSELEIEGYQLSSLCKINFLKDGDHNLKPRVKSGLNHQQHLTSAALFINNFIKRHINELDL